uniref:BCMA TALL-1 binding domain-containing protein n=1 Tax=Cyanoderma ruficeps TaxID=181631 RepID=A0A8C3R657_9PASS
LLPLMAQCPKNEYFDHLLLSCTPCHLRCSSAPPPSCENYCEKSNLMCLDMFTWNSLDFHILKANTESSVNTEEIRHTLPSETLMYSVEECTCSDCGLVKPQTGCETSFPLPATEERATVLVTTKSFDYYNYSSISTLFSATQLVIGIFNFRKSLHRTAFSAFRDSIYLQQICTK